MIKKIVSCLHSKHKHWVGNGFHVHGLLRPNEELNSLISPFIMMDYASPKVFKKTNVPRGVGEHPHRGFETVTFSYQGEIQHRDSTGGGGIIKEGDVQWMTAGRGIIHEEFHSDRFSRTGGTFEMVQIWINLPKKNKMTAPKYQGIEKENIPMIKLTNEIKMRLIAGEYRKQKGPAKTFTNINIMDFFGKRKSKISINLDQNTNTILLILSGRVELNSESYYEKSVIIFDQKGTEINFHTSDNFKALLLNGKPINEPIVSYGPFVMNSEEEIEKAIRDYKNGTIGNFLS